MFNYVFYIAYIFACVLCICMCVYYVYVYVYVYVDVDVDVDVYVYTFTYMYICVYNIVMYWKSQKKGEEYQTSTSTR